MIKRKAKETIFDFRMDVKFLNIGKHSIPARKNVARKIFLQPDCSNFIIIYKIPKTGRKQHSQY